MPSITDIFLNAVHTAQAVAVQVTREAGTTLDNAAGIAGDNDIVSSLQAINQGDTDKIPLDALMLSVIIGRAELLDQGLREQVGLVQKKNMELEKYNTILGQARSDKQGSSDKDKTAVSKSINNFVQAKGIPWGDKTDKTEGTMPSKLKGPEWDLLIENIRGKSESLTSSSQLDMTRLQSTSGKFNQTFEMGSQFISKYFRNTESIIKNI